MKTINEELKNWKCKFCSNTKYTLQRVKIHLGVYCAKCDTWNRWINQERICPGCTFFKLKRKNYYCTFRINIDNVADINIELCKYKHAIATNQKEFEDWF
jgi:hypothetical protein